MSKPTSIRLPEDLQMHLGAEAQIKRMSISGLIIEKIRDSYREKEPLSETEMQEFLRLTSKIQDLAIHYRKIQEGEDKDAVIYAIGKECLASISRDAEGKMKRTNEGLIKASITRKRTELIEKLIDLGELQEVVQK